MTSLRATACSANEIALWAISAQHRATSHRHTLDDLNQLEQLLDISREEFGRGTPSPRSVHAIDRIRVGPKAMRFLKLQQRTSSCRILRVALQNQSQHTEHDRLLSIG